MSFANTVVTVQPSSTNLEPSPSFTSFAPIATAASSAFDALASDPLRDRLNALLIALAGMASNADHAAISSPGFSVGRAGEGVSTSTAA
jgi:hypothetical protein